MEGSQKQYSMKKVKLNMWFHLYDILEKAKS